MNETGMHRQRNLIEYENNEMGPVSVGSGVVVAARNRMRCEVEVFIDFGGIVYGMGPTACQSKSGKCRDGHVTVKRIGAPVEVSRKAV